MDRARLWRITSGPFAGLAITSTCIALASLKTCDAAKVDVTTYHNDLGRTGQNNQEHELTPDLLRGQDPKRTFRRLWSIEVDGQIYAQPLVLTDVPVLVPGSGASEAADKDLVIVATQNNSVYAFDAAAPARPQGQGWLWRWTGITKDKDNRDVLVPLPAHHYVDPTHPNLLDSPDIVPKIGITGTPVIGPDPDIDPKLPKASRRGRLYCVTKSLNLTAKSDADRYVQRIHAIDLTSGREVASRVIEATYPGSGTGIDPGKASRDPLPPDYEKDGGYDPAKGTQAGGSVRFLPKCQNQRAGLLLLNGVVYITWSSHGDRGAYHGWLMGYDARTLDQVSVFNTTPNSYDGAIWQGGVAPAADDRGFIYLATGDGPFDADTTFVPYQVPSATNFGHSVLKLSTAGRSLRVEDYFSPFDRKCLDASDLDLGSGGVMLLLEQPGSPYRLLSLLGKQGTIFLLNREQFGRPIRKDADTIVRRMSQVLGEKYGAGAYFNGSLYYGGGPLGKKDATPIYRLSVAKALEQHRPDFDAQTHRPNGEPVAFALKGSNPSISSLGTDHGILWTIRADYGNENTAAEQKQPTPLGKRAVLYAFDATTLELLWASDDASRGGQTLGDRIKFSVPTIANGRVFIGTGRSDNQNFEGELNVFGMQ